MQRKALKQLGKVTQWTNEKVFSGEKTAFSSDFTEFERDIEVKRKGIERLHATSSDFFSQVTKSKASADPYPPPGSEKSKMLASEALGLVMIDYGGDIGGPYGDWLDKYGRARCRLAMAQEVFGSKLRENYMSGQDTSLGAVNDYKVFRKKLESRRLALDAAISKLKNAKKDHAALENEVEIARERFEEIEAETSGRMEIIQGGEEVHFADLTDFLNAELEYFSKCKEILEDLREQWPNFIGTQRSNGRSRANTATSARSVGSRGQMKSYRSAPVSSDDEDGITNRNRSQSNASATSKGKGKGSMLSSLGKSALAGMVPKRKSSRFVNENEHDKLHSDDEGDEYDDYAPFGDTRRSPGSPRKGFAVNGRSRSTSTLSVSQYSIHSDSTTGPAAPSLRRNYTSPPGLGARYVKAVYDFAGSKHDELAMKKGMIVEVKSEVSDDWWIGESEGRSGLFPSAYTEEYVPAGLAPSMTARRGPPSPIIDHLGTSDSELSQGFEDADHFATAGLTTAAQPAGSSSSTPANRSRSNTASKKAPPPPPARRSQSSTSIMNVMQPTKAPTPIIRSRAGTINSVGGSRGTRLETSPEGSPFVGSPFAGSGDESDGGAARGGTRGLSHGLGGIRIKDNLSDSD